MRVEDSSFAKFTATCMHGAGECVYRGTSLIRNSTPLGPYSRPISRALWWSERGELIFISKLLL